MQDLVTALIQLDPHALHARADAAAKRQAAASWELAACLVAMEKSALFRAFGCASVLEYSERHLGLGVCKTLELLRGGRVLERFPRLSEACRDGRLCWSKLREIARAVEPQTEEQWVAFAASHSTREVERAVAISAEQYRQAQAAAGQAHSTGCAATTASVDAARKVRAMEQPSLLAESDREVSASNDAHPAHGAFQPESASSVACATATMAVGVEATAPNLAARSGAPAVRPPAPAPPRLVRVEMYLTPDQFAIWDKALDRVRSEKSRQVSKEVALEALARHYLASGDSRTRAHHPVVLRSDPASGTTWYETTRGILPASQEATEDALARERGTFMAAEGEVGRDETLARGPINSDSDSYDVRAAADAAVAPPQAVPDPRDEDGDGGEELPERHEDTPRGEPLHGSQRKAIPASRRRAALARANYRCERCGATVRLEVDHVTPVCDGGADLALQVLCHDCHVHRHAEDLANDIRYIRGRADGIARRKERWRDW